MGWGGQRRWDQKEEAPEMQSWGHLCLQLSLRYPLWTRHLPGWWAEASSLYSVLSWVAVLLRGWHSGQLGSRQGTQSGQRPCPWLGWGEKHPEGPLPGQIFKEEMRKGACRNQSTYLYSLSAWLPCPSVFPFLILVLKFSRWTLEGSKSPARKRPLFQSPGQLCAAAAITDQFRWNCSCLFTV